MTSFPSSVETGSMHDLVADPLTCTVQAPHCAIPHPYFVPTRPRWSRSTHSNGVSPATSASYGLPLIFRLKIGMGIFFVKVGVFTRENAFCGRDNFF